MSQPTTTQPADQTKPARPRSRRSRVPAWMQRPPVVVCVVLIVAVAEIAWYALVGPIWWAVTNAAVVAVVWAGVLAWRRKKGGLLDAILSAWSRRTGRQRTGGGAPGGKAAGSKAGRRAGGRNPLSRMLGGLRSRAAGGGKGKSPKAGGKSRRPFAGLGKLFGRPSGSPSSSKPGGKKRSPKSGGKGSGIRWPFSNPFRGGKSGKPGSASKPGKGKSPKSGGGPGAKTRWPFGVGGKPRRSGKPGGGGKGKSPKGGGKSRRPLWRRAASAAATLGEAGRDGWRQAMEDDAARQLRRAERRNNDDAGGGSQPDSEAADEHQDQQPEQETEAAFGQEPPPRQGETMVAYQDGASLFRWGRNLATISPALTESAQEYKKVEETLSAKVAALKKVASQGDNEQVADKTLIAEIENIARQADAILHDPMSAKLQRLANEAEALPRRYKTAHVDDESRLEGRRGGKEAEKNADVAKGEQDT